MVRCFSWRVRRPDAGAASLYLYGARDATNTPLDGGKSYRLRVPPNLPAKQFRAVTVYGLETTAFHPRIAQNRSQLLSRPAKKGDHMVDMYSSGRSGLPGKESNWIYTVAGKPWVAFFRFDGPEPAIHDKTWVLNDIEKTR